MANRRKPDLVLNTTKQSEEEFSMQSLKSEDEACPKLEERCDLSWPASNERDLTQIHKDDHDANHGDISATVQGKVKMRKCQHKICDSTSQEYTKHDPNQRSVDLMFVHIEKKRKITVPSPATGECGAETAEHMNHWNRLSDEIILAIFSFLTKKSLAISTKVCKRWHRLGHDESLWSSIDLTGLFVMESALKRLLLRGIIAMRIARAQLCPSEADELQEFMPISTTASHEVSYNLQYLDASSCNIPHMEKVLSKCRSLKKLSLESCSLSTDSIRAIGNCSKLSVLNLCMCSNLSKTGIAVLSRKCTRITELNLSWTNLTPECVSQVVRGFPSLVKLNLSGCRHTIHDEAIEQLLETCQNLTELDVSDCTVLTERSIEAFIRHGKLEDLSLSRCYEIAPKSLELLSSLKSLKTLQMFGFLSKSGLQLLEKSLPGVRMNGNMFSSIARPAGTMYTRRIWGVWCSKVS